jgi:hypothetical protein
MMATVVAFHAHPDDEVLLTGGTIARLAAEGHRVIIVVACDGDVLPGPGQGQRLGELRASAAILGADKAVWLGYADSGHGPVLFEDPPGRTRFARADVGEAAARLAALLADESADLLLSYDPRGGNGHRDHVRVHRVGGRPSWRVCDVRPYAAQKRAALAAHRTPASGRGRSARLFRALLRSPLPVFRVACGTEWFAEPGGRTGELADRHPVGQP